MVLPTTQPLAGEFWYVLDDENSIAWRPRSRLRGDFYLGWLGQNKNVVAAGLARIEQGQLTHICTHGTPYYWLQPYEALPIAREVLDVQQMLGADTATPDLSLAGWGMRDQQAPKADPWPDASIPDATLQALLGKAVTVIVANFRSEGEPPVKAEYSGLLARAIPAQPLDPLEALLNILKRELDHPNVVPVLLELVKHDINVLPGYRETSIFEHLPTGIELPTPNKVARLVLSTIYQLAPLLGSRQLNSALLLNDLRQRHPFDVTWGADFLVKCFGMSSLARLLLVALIKEQSDQVRGNALDLMQELGYGTSAGLESEVLKGLTDLQSREDIGAFGQVINSHFSFVQEYLRQRDAAAQPGN
jgi:hypothetical protein